MRLFALGFKYIDAEVFTHVFIYTILPRSVLVKVTYKQLW